jgi:flagellar basal body rod protein FlgC
MHAPGLVVENDCNNVSIDREARCFQKTLCGSTWLPPRSRRVSRDESILSAFAERLGFAGGALAGRTSDGKSGVGNHPHPQGAAYTRKNAVFISAPQTSGFSAVSQTELGSGGNGVEVSEVVEDTGAPDQRYIPGHTGADPDGHVAYLSVNPAEDMLNLMDASRNFQTHVAAMTAIKDTPLQSINLMK